MAEHKKHTQLLKKKYDYITDGTLRQPLYVPFYHYRTNGK